MKKMLKYLTRKERHRFWFITGINVGFFLGGIVMMCFGMGSGGYGFILLITYIPYYMSLEDLAEIRSRRDRV